jgi:hypothetical protein
LAKNGYLLALVGHQKLQAARKGDGASDLEESPPVASQLGRRLDVGCGCPGRFGQKEHAMELGRHGYGDSLHGIGEDGVWYDGQREAEELVVALDAGTLGHAIVVVWVYRLLVAALDVGEGVFVGARVALELGRELLEVVCRVGVLTSAQTS